MSPSFSRTIPHICLRFRRSVGLRNSNEAVRRIDQKINVTNATLVKVPFDLSFWQIIAAEEYPNGLPEQQSNDPTQWLFSGHVKGSKHPLLVTIARLLGYRWPRQAGSKFSNCPILGPDGLEGFADEDGILCIPSVRGEPVAAELLRAILASAFGDEWSLIMERKLIAEAESSAITLEDWLRNDFFQQHCKLFAHRPFIWHIWDGRRHDGFHALVNYHKLAAPNGDGRKLLENLTYSYLGDRIARQRDGVKRGEGGADDRLAAALELEKLLKAILDGEPPFDIFVRWKPLHQQPIDWEPNINWGKDKGKEPVRPQKQYPWFWKKGIFTGERLNDLHSTNTERLTAKDAKGSGN